jgi:ectoine hydroxylase-related dioxygenase (phytanoyl-CoA dioxygenase family)
MTIDQALHELGVRDDTLTRAEKESLDRDGYLHLRGIFSRQVAQRMRREMQRLFELEQTGQEGMAAECQQMQNKSDAFDICVTHPRVLAAVRYVLRVDIVSQGVHSRPNPPGKGRQAMHQDGEARDDGVFETCNSIWPLTDFTRENGATRVVPGSHRFGKAPNTFMPVLTSSHPDEIQLEAPVGDVIVFNGSLWHSAMLNCSTADRPNVTSFWSVRTARIFDASLHKEAQQRLSLAARRLFPG